MAVAAAAKTTKTSDNGINPKKWINQRANNRQANALKRKQAGAHSQRRETKNANETTSVGSSCAVRPIDRHHETKQRAWRQRKYSLRFVSLSRLAAFFLFLIRSSSINFMKFLFRRVFVSLCWLCWMVHSLTVGSGGGDGDGRVYHVSRTLDCRSFFFIHFYFIFFVCAGFGVHAFHHRLVS